MGAVATVCTVAAFATSYTQYYQNGTTPKTWPAIVNGGSCQWQVSNFGGQAGDTATFFNVTLGPNTPASVTCVTTAGGSCNTPFVTWNANAYSIESFEMEELNYSGTVIKEDLTYNFSLAALPPVPSQTPLFNFLSGGTQVNVTVSQYGAEYGSPLTGCVLSAGKTPYFAKDLPSTLSATPSSNSLPFYSLAYYTPSQGQSMTVNLQDLNVSPNNLWDIHWVCYNGNGMSADTAMYNILTSPNLPTPKSPPSPTSNSAASGVAPLSALAGGLLLVAAALSL